MFIRFITTGGTIDKVYFDALSQFEVGDSPLGAILSDGLVSFDFDIVPMFRKDSLELTMEDREELKRYIGADDINRYVISHGTDTMVETAEVLHSLTDTTIVLTGSLSPARFNRTDAIFNVGMAVAAVQTAKPGVYIAMSGKVFAAGDVKKNREENRFERR